VDQASPPVPEGAGPRWDMYRDDTFLIVGFTERTGRSVAQVLEEQGIRYKISDVRPRHELEKVLAGLSIDPEDVYAGPQDPEQLQEISRVILSPGVPRSIPLVQEAKASGIPVLGDVDFFCEVVRPSHMVAITGTDGKTTTTMLTAAVLAVGAKSDGEPAGRGTAVVVAGNVGQPVFARYREILECDFLVLELSSYMLEETYALRPQIAAITNIAEDHLDRYASLNDYIAAKKNIVRHCRSGDVFIQNLDDPVLGRFRPKELDIRTVSRKRPSADYHFADGRFHFGGAELDYSDCLLRGDHNVENILIALAIGCEAGVDPVLAALAVKEFPPVPHRFEYLGRHGDVDVYDDSKATTVHAVGHALDSFAENVVLIVGGRAKDLDFAPLREHEPKIKLLMCYGEAGKEIRDRLAFSSSDYVYGFSDAVARAAAACEPGDILLLSPGCTSWDQHTDYAARGVEFGELVRRELG
jgi:UDP-N-acetylmuramoylalanine--D-glutamate ligase